MAHVFDRNESRAIMQQAHKLARALKAAGKAATYAAALSIALKRVHAAVKATYIAREWLNNVSAWFKGEIDASSLTFSAAAGDSIKLDAYTVNDACKYAHMFVMFKHADGEFYTAHLDGGAWQCRDEAATKRFLDGSARRLTFSNVLSTLNKLAA